MMRKFTQFKNKYQLSILRILLGISFPLIALYSSNIYAANVSVNNNNNNSRNKYDNLNKNVNIDSGPKLVSQDNHKAIVFNDPCQYITYTIGMEFFDGTKMYLPFLFRYYKNENHQTIIDVSQNVGINILEQEQNNLQNSSILADNQIFNQFENLYTQYGLYTNKQEMEKMAIYAKLHPFATLDDYSHVINPKYAHVFHIHFLCLNHGLSEHNEKGTVFLKTEEKTIWYKNN
jgi:hypothetical protein